MPKATASLLTSSDKAIAAMSLSKPNWTPAQNSVRTSSGFFADIADMSAAAIHRRTVRGVTLTSAAAAAVPLTAAMPRALAFAVADRGGRGVRLPAIGEYLRQSCDVCGLVCRGSGRGDRLVLGGEHRRIVFLFTDEHGTSRSAGALRARRTVKGGARALHPHLRSGRR